VPRPNRNKNRLNRASPLARIPSTHTPRANVVPREASPAKAGLGSSGSLSSPNSAAPVAAVDDGASGVGVGVVVVVVVGLREGGRREGPPARGCVDHVRFCRYRFKFQSHLVWDLIKPISNFALKLTIRVRFQWTCILTLPRPCILTRR
jgi:hypothetical protein